MAINIMGELQERIKKIEYVSLDDLDELQEESEAETVSKMSENIEKILEKLSGQGNHKSEADVFVEALANIYSAVLDIKNSLSTGGIKISKVSMAKAVENLLEKCGEELAGCGMVLENPEGGQYDPMLHEAEGADEDSEGMEIERVVSEGISYKGRIVKKAVVELCEE